MNSYQTYTTSMIVQLLDYDEPVNDTVNDDVFLLIKEKNTITASEISERLNLSLSSVRRRMKALKDAGKLQRLGSDKNGHWRIIV